jgi:hypothetical protein
MRLKELQIELFDRLIAKHGKAKLVESIRKLLFLEKTAIYQRINGEKELLFSELIFIAKHFHVSLDRMTGMDNTIVFELPKPIDFAFTPQTFLESIAKDLSRAANLKMNKMCYSGSEIPIYYYFYFPEITYFKLFIWSRTVWRVPWLKDKKFPHNDPNMFGGEAVFDLAREMQRLFFQLESVEIWATNILQNTLQQILFCAKIRRFEHPETAYLLINQLREIMQKMEKMTESGHKSIENTIQITPFQVFHNVTATANNVVILEADAEPKMAYLTIDNPNFLRSADPIFCAYAKDSFDKLMSNSVQISNASEVNRAEFFQQIYAQIDQSMEHLGRIYKK